MPRLPEPYYSYVTILAALARAETVKTPILGATPVKFDMRDWGRRWIVDDPVSCGTAACLAGLCQLVFDEPVTKVTYRNNYVEPKYAKPTKLFARDFLGLSELDANYLFMVQARNSSERGVALHHITGEIAAQMLLNYAETGILDWEKAFADVGLYPDDYFESEAEDEDDC